MNPFKTIVLCLALPMLAFSRAETFSEKAMALADGKPVMIRGVINAVSVPVADDAELGAVQSGYFLFTASECKVTGKDDDGKPMVVAGQQMFHLTPSEEQVKEFRRLLGKPVELQVVPFFAHTRHHRTPVLLQVKSVRLLGK